MNDNKIELSGSRTFKANKKHFEFKFKAETLFDKIESIYKTVTLPRPHIIDFRPKEQKLEFGRTTQLIWNVEHVSRVELHYEGNMEVVNNQGEKFGSPKEGNSYQLSIIALDGKTNIKETISVNIVKPLTIKEFKSQNKTVFKGEFARLSWDVENYTDLTVSPANINVTGKTYIMVVPESTTTYILTAKNELHSVSSDCTIEVIKKPISWWIPLGAGFFIFFLSAIGWYWNKQNSDLEKIKQIQTLILQGQKIAPNDVDAAKNIFHKVIELNKSLPKDLKVTSMANVAQNLIEEGDKRCKLNVPALKYLAENNYQLAAILTENPNPKTCK